MPTKNPRADAANWLSCRGAAIRSGLNQRAIRQLVATRRLPSLKMRGRYLIARAALDNLLAGVGAQPLEGPPAPGP